MNAKIMPIIVFPSLAGIIFLGVQYFTPPVPLHRAPKQAIMIPNISTLWDIDKDGINDIDDIVQWARKEAENKTTYRSVYYKWGYPPKGEWVCTDVIWRAFKNAGIDLKTVVDEDIRKNGYIYNSVIKKPDPNIDFRRVPNLDIFLQRHATMLTNEVISGNIDNLREWQAGDIVVFSKPNQHIAIVSDKRDGNGVPYLIHSYGDFAKEDVWVLYADRKILPIVGHYRWKYGNSIGL